MNISVGTTGQKSSRKLTWQKRLLFFGGAFLIAIFAVELGVRVIFAFRVGPRVLLYGTSYYRNKTRPPIDNHTVWMHENSQSGYTKYFPNETKVDHNPETGEVFSVTINSRGFRGKEFTETKQLGVIRVVTLGASSTFGYFNKDNETYPYFLEKLLNQEAENGTSFEVINLAVPHLTSEEILSLFMAEVLPLNPDVVTFYEGINDSTKWKTVSAVKTPGVRKRLSSISWLRSSYRCIRDILLSVKFVDSFLVDIGGVKTFSPDDFQKHLEGKSEHFLKNISALMAECREKGIIFIASKQQARSKTVENFAEITYAEEVEMIQEKLRGDERINFTELCFLTHNILTRDLESWALSNNVPLVDVIELLDQDRDVLLSSVHLSPRGNKMIAEAFASEIKRQLVWRGRLPKQ